MAIGNYPNPLLRTSTTLVKYDQHDCLIVDENNQTTCKGIYGGGDVVTGLCYCYSGDGSCRKGAYAIDQALQEKK